MAQDTSTKLAADYDVVVAQLAALRDDMSKLASTVAQVGSRQGQTLIHDVNEGMAEAAGMIL